MVEEWRPIPSLHGLYEASSLGNVRHPISGTVYQARPGPNGYWRVQLLVDGRREYYPVYLLVADAFHGTRPSGFVVDHLDGDKSNNRPENLEWVSIKENVQRAWKAGLMRP